MNNVSESILCANISSFYQKMRLKEDALSLQVCSTVQILTSSPPLFGLNKGVIETM